MLLLPFVFTAIYKLLILYKLLEINVIRLIIFILSFIDVRVSEFIHIDKCGAQIQGI